MSTYENNAQKKARTHYFLTRILKLPIQFQGTIIDLETTGLNPETAEIISIGLLTGETLTILAITNHCTQALQEFHNAIATLLSSAPQPVYAYNASFEKAFLEKKIGLSLAIVDAQEPLRDLCKEARRQGHSIKWPRLSEVTGSRLNEYFGIRDEEILGNRIASLWKKFLRKKDQRLLEKIMYHNSMDVIRTLELLIWLSVYEQVGILPAQNIALRVFSAEDFESWYFHLVCEICQEEKSVKDLFSVRKLTNTSQNNESRSYYVCISCLGFN